MIRVALKIALTFVTNHYDDEYVYAMNIVFAHCAAAERETQGDDDRVQCVSIASTEVYRCQKKSIEKPSKPLFIEF